VEFVATRFVESNWDLRGWWSLFGVDKPELREIAKALAGMTPSSFPFELFFSLQKYIHSVAYLRNIWILGPVAPLTGQFSCEGLN